jgi:hypothetical protein
MNSARLAHPVKVLTVAIAVLFGVATIVAGGRVLFGADPGYLVFRPLLSYNTLMGLAYVAAGVIIWRNVLAGRKAAGAIFVLNLLVLVGIVVMYRSGGAVAIDSLRAMILRTVIWLGIFLAALWLDKSRTVA